MDYIPLDTGKKYLVTGVAGFIGSSLAKKLLEHGCQVIGIDNINDYYDINLKYTRLEQLTPYEDFSFIKGDIADKELILSLFEEHKPNIVINLAAQAGVRHSIDNPDVYIQSNVVGFFNILEACRYNPVNHLVYASSSSIYGSNEKVPFEETDVVDHPESLYAATKKSNELMAYTYSHLYKIPTTALRFFTVYGPLGRPDMAYFGFTQKYFNGEPIRIFNNGDFNHDLYRDFTYIDDIVEGIRRILSKAPEDAVPHKIFNIGNNNPEKLMFFIETLEKCLGKSLGREVEFNKIFEPIKPGDVPATYASTELLQAAVGFKPSTSIEEGLQKFTDWYVKYYEAK
ncbi:GDP-mannose 4,6-dehydratase [Paenibacillus sp. FSL H3-0469]|uniref:GDP-mannose 4,6-dehydratase n=1 Tax=Paenibacillus sp. FSL H3-0469 TaxID=2954506 RepID=UPI003100F251